MSEKRSLPSRWRKSVCALGALLLLVLVASVFGPLWWWALHGMSPDVSMAWQLTAFIEFCTLGPAGVALVIQPWTWTFDDA